MTDRWVFAACSPSVCQCEVFIARAGHGRVDLRVSWTLLDWWLEMFYIWTECSQSGAGTGWMGFIHHTVWLDHFIPTYYWSKAVRDDGFVRRLFKLNLTVPVCLVNYPPGEAGRDPSAIGEESEWVASSWLGVKVKDCRSDWCWNSRSDGCGCRQRAGARAEHAVEQPAAAGEAGGGAAGPSQGGRRGQDTAQHRLASSPPRHASHKHFQSKYNIVV